MLSWDINNLYKINRKYYFTNESLLDDYNSFYFATAVFMNFIYMNSCKEAFNNNDKVASTFNKVLDTLTSNMSKTKECADDLNKRAQIGYQYYNEQYI